jgi:hypothetical protein
MVRIEDLNITFFHLPKNAGSSIAQWLVDNLDGDEYFDDLRHETPQKVLPLFGDLGWSFCCVRNPWDRVVSWYNFFRGQNKINCNFETYMDKIISKQYTSKYILPIQQQMYMVDSVDHVIKYENLVEDFKVIQEKTNCFEPLVHINKSRKQNEVRSYVNYYTKDSYINHVGEVCKREIAYFNYSFGG